MWLVYILIGGGIGLGILYLRGLANDRIFKETETEMSDRKTEVAVGQEIVAVDEQLVAEVVSWDGEQSELTFKLKESGKIGKVVVDSDNMSIFIPEAGHKTSAVLPLVKGSVHWESAFCPQDGLTVGYGVDGVVRLLFNTGYRMCGFQGY